MAELSLAEGFLSQLQLLNAIERIKKDSQSGMPAPNVRRILFWDTDFDKINWKYSERFVINRVEKYGSSEEIQTIRDYYEL